MKFHSFDPYWQEGEQRARASADQQRWINRAANSLKFSHADPEVNWRRNVRQSQSHRAKKRPPTLAKVQW